MLIWKFTILEYTTCLHTDNVLLLAKSFYYVSIPK